MNGVTFTNTGFGARTKFGGAAATPEAAPAPATQGGIPSASTVLLGMFLLLIALKFAGESPRTAIDPAHISIGGYNLFAVTVTSITGIVLLKWLFNRWQVPGVTDLINAV